jgi:cephalosporin hydroxylase
VSQTKGAVLVILDSDHSEQHVYNELTHYSALVTPGSYCLVQDGVIDRLRIFKGTRPGPLPAIMRFLKEHDDFIVREDLSNRFLITHHPKGWLQRKRDG